MFTALVLRGRRGTLLFGGRATAAVCRRWSITKNEEHPFTLVAAIEQLHPFYVRQRPLMFTAPRPGGFWSWPVETLTVGATTITARLGPPEY